MKKNIGVETKAPDKKCEDVNCPYHGALPVRGRTFVGKVISARMTKTVTVVFDKINYVPKYERYEKRRTRLKAHNPECINAKEGDTIKIMECKPLSKTKKFVIIEVLNESN